MWSYICNTAPTLPLRSGRVVHLLLDMQYTDVLGCDDPEQSSDLELVWYQEGSEKV